MINLQKSANIFIIIIITLLCVSPAFALGEENRNLLLIGVMVMSPVLIIAFNKFDKSDIWILLFLISIIVIPLLNKPQSMRWSTVLYSCMFGLTFMAYSRLLFKSKLSPYNYLKILKIIIIAYAITLLIQQFCVLLGLPIFNVSSYDVTTPWKLNSLASEPSISARIVFFLMYNYIITKQLLLKRKYILKKDFYYDRWIWFAILWIALTMGSATAFLFLFLLFAKFIKFNNTLVIVLSCFTLFVLFKNFEITAFSRAFEVTKATLTFDKEVILSTDHSAAQRIVPIIVLAEKLGFSKNDDWLGHGIDYTSTFLSDEIYGIPYGTSGGGLLQLWLEYGFISFLIFVFLTLKYCFYKEEPLSLVFWFFLVFLYGVNNQIVWLCIIMLWTYKYYYNLIESSN